jgi:putative oxidoreductase
MTHQAPPEVIMSSISKTGKVVSWILRITAAVILLQTLFFKFTGAPESVYIFTKVHMEPWGRYGTGMVELIASLLLLMRCRCWAGALLALGVMAGAIVSHLTVLGIVVQNDGGLLFGLAVTVTVCSVAVLVLHREQIPFVGRRFKKEKS